MSYIYIYIYEKLFSALKMGRVGFEPTKHYVSDLQSDPFGRSGTDPHSINDINRNSRVCQV